MLIILQLRKETRISYVEYIFSKAYFITESISFKLSAPILSSAGVFLVMLRYVSWRNMLSLCY